MQIFFNISFPVNLLNDRKLAEIAVMDIVKTNISPSDGRAVGFFAAIDTNTHTCLYKYVCAL